jgi:tetratricopeptide (TPR) repeat protein
MKENVALISTKIIQIGLLLLAFLTPIFFLSTTSEFYSFNKTTLLVVGAFFLFFVWGVKMVAEQKVRITRTPLDIPLLVLLLVFILASIFSVDQVISIYGWHPTFFGSLPSLAAIIMLYFLAASHLNSGYRVATYIALAASASTLAVVGLAYYFGHPLLSYPWAQSRSWTPAGDLDKLVFLLSIAIPLTISLALSMKEPVTKYFFYALAALQLVSFALVNNPWGYVALVVALFFVLLLSPRVAFPSQERWTLAVLAVLTILVLAVVNVKGASDAVLKPLIAGKDTSTAIAKPIRLPLSAGWQVAAKSLADRPIFGSGPATFGLVYPTFKPLAANAINTNNLWNIRFDEPSSAVLGILTTTGAIGILALLLVVVTLLRSLVSFSAASDAVRANPGFIFLQGSLVAFLVGLIFFDLSAITALVFVILAGAYFSTLRDWGSSQANEVDLRLVELKSGVIGVSEATDRPAKRVNAMAWIFVVAALIVFGGGLLLSWNSYRAEFYYQKAILASQANKGKETRDNLVAAINANNYRDTYHRALLVTDLALARALNQKGELSQDEQNTLLALVREAIDQGRITTGYEGRGLGSFQIKSVPGTSTLNVANWESLATVYANIGGQLKSDATIHAINTYSRSIQLDPTNPRLYEALGSVYFNAGDTDNAIKNFELAVSAKPDYASAHYNLAQAVKKKGENPARVVNELSATLQLLEDNEQNKATRERIQKELDDANKELEKVQKEQQSQQPIQQIPTATSSAQPR